MRIVDRKTFIGMPSGTLFCKYHPCVFGDLMIKGDSIIFEGGDDFYYQQIVDAIDCSSSSEWSDILFDSEAHGTSFSMDFDCQGRDGLFERNQLFAVWDQADVEALITRLIACRAT